MSALDTVKPLPPINADQERALVQQAQNGDKAAVATLIRTQAPFLWRLAVKSSTPAMSADDLFQAGIEGLMQAIEQHDNGHRLFTYAMPFVKRRMFDAVSSGSWAVTVPYRSLLRYFAAVRNTDSLDDAKTWAGDRAQGRRMAAETFEAVHDALNGATTLDSDEAQAAADDVEATATASALVAALLDKVSGRDREVVVLHYGLAGEEPMSDGAIAKRLGIDRTRVVRIRNRALGVMREAAE